MFNKIAILGAGHGGCTMAADLSMAGYHVNLYELPEFADNLLGSIIEKGGLEVIARKETGEELKLSGGGKTGFARISGKITSDIKQAIDDADLIMLVTPAFARERFIKELGTCIKEGQTVVIWPGYFGALRCAKILKDMGVYRDITICETESLIYATRRTGPTEITVLGTKDRLACSVFPASKTTEVIKGLQKIFPAIVPARNVLETTLANGNLVIHPQCLLLNLYRVERKFYPYYESMGGPFCSSYDVTPGMAGVMEAVDKERRAIAEKFELNILSEQETLKAFYGATGKNLYEALLNCYAYQKQLAPTSLNHRYVTEDVPYGLVPLASLGDQIQVPVPTIKGMVAVGCAATGEDYWSKGLTMSDVGLAGKSVEEIIALVEKGF